jgi:hypothetical protein
MGGYLAGGLLSNSLAFQINSAIQLTVMANLILSIQEMKSTKTWKRVLRSTFQAKLTLIYLFPIWILILMLCYNTI